ncbi:protein of unknown function [Methylocella tundrae]|uniref:Uncharacterized protein n=1 Tax=Methylocella tundrae TaxID=227605 RepID=A0A4U8YZK6_METTU|nr:protein of unknown function [Methylocella tundrae]
MPRRRIGGRVAGSAAFAQGKTSNPTSATTLRKNGKTLFIYANGSCNRTAAKLNKSKKQPVIRSTDKKIIKL